MTITRDIMQSWRSPRAVIRRKLDEGVREDRLLAVIFGACALIFVSQWPLLSRAAFEDPSVPLDARLGAALMGIVFLGPLIAYGLAALSHVVARLLGAKGTHSHARLALFWALLAATPLLLVNGLVAGFVGQGPVVVIVGLLVLAGFAYLWLAMLIEVER